MEPFIVKRKSDRLTLFFSENLNKNNWRFLRDVFFDNFYNKNNIFKTNNINDCDIIVIYEKYEIHNFLNYKKKIILINADPATNCFCNDDKIIINDVVIHVMNGYNGLFSNNLENGYLFTDTFTELKFYPIKKLDMNIIVMNTFRSYENNFNKENIYDISNNLVDLRNKLTIYFYEKNMLRIYGKDWPNINCIDTFTNNPNWRQDKLDILSKGVFKFMICFENYEIDYWITEKIWDCIENHILPIYCSSKTIYDIFPPNSFIDYTNYIISNSNEINFNNLYSYLSNMSVYEYNKRMKLCVDTYNKIKKEYTSEKYLSVYEDTCKKIITKLKSI